MIPKEKLQEIREELLSCERPIFFFHDDPDGVASFLLFYKFVGSGKGIIIKSYPKITEMYASKVEEYQADKVFILDIAMVDQEFIDKVNVPIIVVDHHDPIKRNGIKYYNPRNYGNNNLPASYICYKVVEQDLWLAVVGCVGDWFITRFCKRVFKKIS